MVKSKNASVFDRARKSLEKIRKHKNESAEGVVQAVDNHVGIIGQVTESIDLQVAMLRVVSRSLKAGHAVIKASLEDPSRRELLKRLISNTLDDLVSRGNELVTLVESASKEERAEAQIQLSCEAFETVQKKIKKLK